MNKTELRDMNSTFLFKQFDSTVGLTNKVKNVLSKNPTIVPYDNFIDEFKIMDKYSFPAKNTILELVRRGSIKLLYSEVDKIPSAIDTIILSSGGNYVAYCNISNYSSHRKRDDKITLDTLTLYTLLNYSAIRLSFYAQWGTISRDANFRKMAMQSYVNLVMRILNKLYSVNVNRTTYDKVAYLVAKFFLVYIAGMEDGDLVDSTAKVVVKDTHDRVIDMMSMGIPEDAFESIDTFVHALNTMIPNLSKLTLRELTDEWMKMYGPSTVLSLEYYPSLMNMLAPVITGVRINNKDSIESVVGKIGIKCFDHFMTSYVAKLC